MELKDTPFEFRHRFWIFMGIFWLAFTCYSVDHVNCVEFVAGHLAKRTPPPSADAWARIMFFVSAALVFAGTGIRVWGTAYLKTDVMQDKRVHSERLLADGPFRYVRNPLYFGNLFFAAGIGLLASRVGFVVLVLGMLIFNFRLISHEEKELNATQGESYRAYCKAVPRFIPSLWPRVPSAGNPAHPLDGFLGEFWGFSFGIASVALAFAFRLKYPLAVYWSVAIGLMALGALLRRLLLPPNGSESKARSSN